MHTHLQLRSDGIVQILYTDSFSFTIKDALESADAMGELTNGVLYPILKIPGKNTIVDRETREFVAKGAGARYSISEAFVLQSMAHKIFANFYIRIDKPQKPTRFYNNFPSAEEWLRKFVK